MDFFPPTAPILFKQINLFPTQECNFDHLKVNSVAGACRIIIICIIIRDMKTKKYMKITFLM